MFPIIAPIRQSLIDDCVADVPAQVRAGMDALALHRLVKPGMHVAVAVGSRGIGCLLPVVRTVLEELRRLEAHPFLVPAMGSHGGGTAEGQKAILEGYGLVSAVPGIEVLSAMETVQIGRTPRGMPVFIDTHAAGADGIIVINRIKEHTMFHGRWESGLCKMLTVGLGKARGAAEIHNWGLETGIPEAARVVLEQLPVLAGIGIVENGKHEPARIAVLPADRILAEEPALLDEARRMLPRIPLEPIDLLIIQEMGKNISGAGMDPNVIGMWRRNGGPVDPEIRTIGALDLTPESHGNAIGVGYADLITRRLRDKIDLEATYLNCLTSHSFVAGRLPIVLPTDRELIRAALGGPAPETSRLVLVRNTLDLEMLWVSKALLPMVAETPSLEQVGPLRPLEFDEDGTLLLSFAE